MGGKSSPEYWKEFARRPARIQYVREYQMRCRQHINAVANAWHAKRPLFTLLKNAQVRAGKKGVPFSLRETDLDCPTHCPILGIEIDYGRGMKKGSQPNSPSLDRTVPHLGYVVGNVRVVSHRANTLRSDATLEELELVLADARGGSK